MVFQVGKGLNDIKTFKWSIQGDELIYIDNRSDHEYRLPPQHEFEWARTHRDLHQSGEHPHIAIDDRIFVETVGGVCQIWIAWFFCGVSCSLKYVSSPLSKNA